MNSMVSVFVTAAIVAAGGVLIARAMSGGTGANAAVAAGIGAQIIIIAQALAKS